MRVEPTFLDVEGAAQFLLVTKATIYAWVHQRKIPYRKHGSKLVFLKDELIRWSNSNSGGSAPAGALPVLLEIKKCYNKPLDSLKTEYSKRRVKQSTHYDPFIEKESS